MPPTVYVCVDVQKHFLAYYFATDMYMYKYRLCSNKTQDLINARKFVFWIFIMYLNVATDDLYQKIAQKLKT